MSPFISSWLVPISAFTIVLLAALAIFTRISHYLRAQRTSQASLVSRINHLLPQTQCGQCGHPGCLPYARAISSGEAINKCPPGGIETIRDLAELLNEAELTLDPAHGQFKPFSVANIREQECIGCTKCIQACPIDAILGGPKFMHTVIESECTGCDLCVEPCPVDCIDMIAMTSSKTEFPDKPSAQACIRCGFCADVCPVNLLPQQLLAFSQSENNSELLEHGLFDCTECGACDDICPSHIPLVSYYQESKNRIHAREESLGKSQQWQQRFQFHQYRIKRDKEQSLARKAKPIKTEMYTPKQESNIQSPMEQEHFSKEKASREIAAAVARVKARRNQLKTKTESENKPKPGDSE